MDPTGGGDSLNHALFLERLDALAEKTLADVKLFAQRENCSFDEVRLHVRWMLCRGALSIKFLALPLRSGATSRSGTVNISSILALLRVIDVSEVRKVF